MTYAIRSYVDGTMPGSVRYFAYHGAFVGYHKCLIQKDQESSRMFLKRCRDYFGGRTQYRDETGSTHLIEKTTSEDQLITILEDQLQPWGSAWQTMTGEHMRILFAKIAYALGLTSREMVKVLESKGLRNLDYSFEAAIVSIFQWGVEVGTISKFDVALAAKLQDGSGSQRDDSDTQRERELAQTTSKNHSTIISA